MSTEHPLLTPEQAREQLAAVGGRSLHLARDRRIHATGTAVFGLTAAVHMTTQNVVTGAAQVVLSCVVLAIFVAEAVVVERAARTVPLRARFWSRTGIGASFVLALGVVLPWLNLQAQTSPNTVPMVLGGAVLVAAPSLLAAVVIARRRT
ncbi:hypothetical protein [Blastococcus haudaquaticus]|uniref:Uncharacterized protein n=1 Tax=Blastococcus haudaquaticus TaxID=1938745 RepID=A0A286GPK0_9ACTN|nr:hypothetical protein [Blastococcus haudaquaticus]SOD97481.1 hypothetical protein SAMN06272739_1502 [Blastococcus haudaquaticus]